MYLAGAAAFVLCGLLVWKQLPSMPKTAATNAPRRTAAAPPRFAAAVRRLHPDVDRQQHVPDQHAAVRGARAAAAGAAGRDIDGRRRRAGDPDHAARRSGGEALRQTPPDARAVVAGVLFYCGLLFITGSWQLIALQLLNAAFIGVLAGIGMLYFQDLMPGRAGAATTLFTNTTRVGWIIAGSIAGAVAEIWNYHAVFYAALAMTVGPRCACGG